MDVPELSLNELAVLGVIGEGQTHGWAIAQELAPDGPLGRIWTVKRALVYRSIALLVERGLVVEVGEAPGARGPQRTIVKITASGRRTLSRWLEHPVDHVREIRTEFLLKVALVGRSGGDPSRLARAQLERLAPVFDALSGAPAADPTLDTALARWRFHSATAVHDFLRELAQLR